MRIRLIKKETWFLLICTVIIIIVGTIYSSGNEGLWIEDEFGYVGAAAYAAGYNWSQLYSPLGYYGFGYGLFLIPAFFLLSSFRQIMIYASVINTIFLALSFLLAARLIRRLFPEKKADICYISAMVAGLYINNIAMTQMLWSESLNLLLYWCILNIMYHIFDRGYVRDYILASVLCCFSIMVHMRNAVVVLPCVGILFIHFLKRKKDIRKVLLFGAIALLGATVFFALKNYYQVNLYNISNGQQANDVESQIKGMLNLFDWKYIAFFIKNFWAKLFYVLTSTVGLSGIGSVAFIYFLYKFMKQKRVYSYSLTMMMGLGFGIFIFAFFMTVYVASIPYRGDIVFYGRYYEPYIGFVLVLGFMYLTEQDQSVGWRICSIIFLWVIYKISFINSEKFYISSIPGFEGYFTFPCVVGIAKYFNMGIGQTKVIGNIFSATVFRLIVLFLIVLIVNCTIKQNVHRQSVLIVVAAIFFIVIQLNDAKAVVDQMKYCKAERYQNVIPIADCIQTTWNQDAGDMVYYYHTEAINDPTANILALQFVIGKTPINIVDELLSTNIDMEDTYIILNKKESEYDKYRMRVLNMGASYVCKTNVFELYRIE